MLAINEDERVTLAKNFYLTLCGKQKNVPPPPHQPYPGPNSKPECVTKKDLKMWLKLRTHELRRVAWVIPVGAM